MSNTSCYWPASALLFLGCRIWMSTWRKRAEADLIVIKWQYSLTLRLTCVSGWQVNVQTASSLGRKSLDVFGDFCWAKATTTTNIMLPGCKTQFAKFLKVWHWLLGAGVNRRRHTAACATRGSSHSTSLIGSATLSEATDDETSFTVG